MKEIYQCKICKGKKFFVVIKNGTQIHVLCSNPECIKATETVILKV